MHNLAVAIGEGVPRKELYQRIAHTAVITTGAMSACIYEKTSSGRLQGVAVEGLFPPERAIKQSKLLTNINNKSHLHNKTCINSLKGKSFPNRFNWFLKQNYFFLKYW